MRERHRDQAAQESSTGAEQRPLVSPRAQPEEAGVDRALRPTSFADYIGQVELLAKFKVYVQAAKLREEALDHVLLHGPPGLGKTTLALILANELGVKLHTTSGPAVEHKGVLAALLTALGPRDLLFIDEIHRLSPVVEESLYSAMEDGRIDLPMGEGSRASTMSMRLSPFTLVGATTRTARLSAPLRDRFQIIEGLRFYRDEDLANIVDRAAARMGLAATPEGSLAIGARSRGTPRIAIRLTRRIRDFVQVEGKPQIEADDVERHLEKLGVDRYGLDSIDRRMLSTVIHTFSGGPVGIDAVAASMGVPRDSLEDVHEPFLLQRGFLTRSPRGRTSTDKAKKHLGDSLE